MTNRLDNYAAISFYVIEFGRLQFFLSFHNDFLTALAHPRKKSLGLAWGSAVQRQSGRQPEGIDWDRRPEGIYGSADLWIGGPKG